MLGAIFLFTVIWTLPAATFIIVGLIALGYL
jgi:hypothetical protein